MILLFNQIKWSILLFAYTGNDLFSVLLLIYIYILVIPSILSAGKSLVLDVVN